MRKSLIIAAALLLAPAVSQAKTLEDLLVEKGVITKAEAKSSTAQAPAKVFWNSGTRFEFPDSGFTAGFNTFIVERYTYSDIENANNKSSFETKKARLIVSGTALDNEFAYMLQGDFVGDKDSTGTGKNVPDLKDAYIQWNACDWAAARMGQYKSLVSRQYVTSDWYLQFPDGSAASNFFNLGRQQGLLLNAWSDDKMFDIKGGIFNGTSTDEGQNYPGVDNKMLGMVAVRVNPTGAFNAYQESDMDYSENLGTSFGAVYANGSQTQVTADDSVDGNIQRFNLDANLKYMGLSANAEYYWGKTDPVGGTSVDTSGFYAQAGYFLTPKKFEIAARYSYVDCDGGLGSGTCAGYENINDTWLALNYYFWKYYVRASLAAQFLRRDGAGDRADSETNNWIFQISTWF